MKTNDSDVYTKLKRKDYKFLERFLDVTKANLFFARGVILVEGWSEELLIPVIADKIGCNLTANEVSIVNVGSTAYLRYAKIFQRNDGKDLKVPIAVVADLDVRPDLNGNFDSYKELKAQNKIKKNKGQPVCTFIAKQWTLEWCLYNSKLSDEFQAVVKKVHSKNIGYSNNFESSLKSHLKKSSFKKVEIATLLAERISNPSVIIDEDDVWIIYLIKAIKYACGKINYDEAD